jgi:hypothetical protein
MHPRQQTILPSASRTADSFTHVSAESDAGAMYVVLDITSVPGAQTLTLNIRGKDTLSGQTFLLLQSAALSASGRYVYLVGRGNAAAGGGVTAVANLAIPPLMEFFVDHSAAGTWTYSLAVHWCN